MQECAQHKDCEEISIAIESVTQISEPPRGKPRGIVHLEQPKLFLANFQLSVLFLLSLLSLDVESNNSNFEASLGELDPC